MAAGGKVSTRWRFPWKFLAIALGCAFVLILLAPALVSTKTLYDPFVRSLAQDKLHLEIGSVKLRWFRPIEIHGISVSDLESSLTSDLQPQAGNRPQLLTIKAIRTDRGLLSHFLSGRKIGRIEIVEPKIDISLLEDSSNLQRLIQSLNRAQSTGERTKEPSPTNVFPGERSGALPGSLPAASPEFPKLDFDLVIRNASIQVEQAGAAAPLAVVPPFTVESEYRGLASRPSLKVQPTKLLDRVELTQELVRLGLGKAIPLIAKSTWFDGNISLDIGELSIPLDDPVSSTASAKIKMHQVRTGPSEPLLVNAVEMIAKLRNKPAALELVFVNDSTIQVKLGERRVHHEGLQAGFPKIDERLQISSSGDVGLVDRSLNLTLEVPVPVEQLARRDVVKEIGVPKIHVPVHGTLDQPEVDWTAMREDSGAILALMAGKLQDDAPVLSTVIGSLGGVAEGQADEAIHATVDLIKSIRDARQNAKEERDSERENGASGANNKRPKRPILDALRQALESPQP